MNLTAEVEQRLLEVMRRLAPEKRQAVVDFAEFLQTHPRSANALTVEASTIEVPSSRTVELAKCGISIEQAAELRSRFQAISEDWERPEMAVYDEL